MNCGIYAVLNTTNNRHYIGSSTDIAARWAHHRLMLSLGRHCNPHLQNSWNKHGADMFIFKIIETCLPNDLITREQYYINIYDTYNLRPADRRIGFTVSDETVEKMSLSAIKFGSSPEQSLQRSIRASEQHEQGNFGYATWDQNTRDIFPETIRRATLDSYDKRPITTKSGIRGIHYFSGRKKPWRAAFTEYGVFNLIGYFETVEEAKSALETSGYTR